MLGLLKAYLRLRVSYIQNLGIFVPFHTSCFIVINGANTSVECSWFELAN